MQVKYRPKHTIMPCARSEMSVQNRNYTQKHKVFFVGRMESRFHAYRCMKVLLRLITFSRNRMGKRVKKRIFPKSSLTTLHTTSHYGDNFKSAKALNCVRQAKDSYHSNPYLRYDICTVIRKKVKYERFLGGKFCVMVSRRHRMYGKDLGG